MFTPFPLVFASMCVLVASIPLDGVYYNAAIGGLSRVVGLLALPAVLAYTLWRGQLRAWTPTHLLLALGALWIFAQNLWTIEPSETLRMTSTWGQLVLLVLAVWECAVSRERRDTLLQAFVLGCGAASAWIAFNYVTGRQISWERYSVGNADPNETGLTLALGLVFALHLLTRGHRRALNGLYLVLGTAGIFLTSSRTSALLLALVLLIGWGRSLLRRGAMKYVLSALLIGGALSLPRVLPESVTQRLSTVFDDTSDASTANGRTEIWQYLGEALPSYLVGGSGVGTMREVTVDHVQSPDGRGMVAHNTFLSILVEQGLPGFLLFFGALALGLRRAWLLAPQERFLWGTASLIWALGVFFISAEHLKFTWLLMAFLPTAGAARQDAPVPAALRLSSRPSPSLPDFGPTRAP